MIVPLSHVLIWATVLFLLGAACCVAHRNVLMILIGVEVMLNAAGLAFVGAALRWQQLDGQAFVLFLFVIAAAEVSVGLALVVCARRHKRSLNVDHYNLFKG
jgi:NADH-quinone oxidoreductase subunit K